MSENSLSSRLKRYSQTSVAVGGLLTRLGAEKYLGLPLDSAQHAIDLTGTLGTLKGPLLKIAQILATVPDMIPDAYATAFLELQSNAPPMGWPFVKRRMQGELGHEWESQFKEFDKHASAAASLGQVHKAVGLDGQQLACKLQYPEMGAAVEADLTQLGLLLTSFERYHGGLDTKNARQEIAARLWEELDYLREAQAMKDFREMLAPFPLIRVPQVIDPLTTSRLLTMTWVEGQKLLVFTNSPQELRNQIATTLFTAWYHPLYRYGVLHGDPHLGNYSWSPEGTLNLLDFGCVRVFSAPFIQGVIDLYRALQTGDEDQAVGAYEAWGFTHLTKDLIHTLTLWARFLYAPFLEDRVRPLNESYSGLEGRHLAGEILSELKRQGGVSPPREFVFMDRAAVGLGSVFIRLKAQLNWHQMFEQLIEGFSGAFPPLSPDRHLKSSG